MLIIFLYVDYIHVTMKLHTGAKHPILIVQVSVHDNGPVGQESSIYTEKSIVPVDADDISKSSRVYTLVICTSSKASYIGLSNPSSLDGSIIVGILPFLNST